MKKKFWSAVGLGLSFKKSGLDLDQKIWQSSHLCSDAHLWYFGNTNKNCFFYRETWRVDLPFRDLSFRVDFDLRDLWKRNTKTWNYWQ